jgi:hypothetical protein
MELAEETDGRAHAEEPFGITFDFRSIGGAERRRLVRGLALGELKARSDRLDRRLLGLGDRDCLTHLRSDEPIPVLVIEERATTGMYGRWSSGDSKMFLALLAQGFTFKGAGAGGSYGFGKAGLIGGSLTRTVVAYTCFRASADDPGVTRRLLGVTYWGPHWTAEGHFSGFARLGDTRRNGIVIPFENKQADIIAEQLGLSIRSAQETTQLGTTFLLLDPAVGPAELLEAVERNWWPAILDNAFEVDVLCGNDVFVPRPRANETLQPFIRGWELATTPQDNAVAEEWSRRFRTTTLASGRSVELGRIGLVADLDAWSYPGSPGDVVHEDPPDDRSLVALIRGPRMVVEYFDCGRVAPFVRGTFVAASDVNDLLRQTEPKAHDCWETDVSTLGIDPEAPVIARSVLERIRRNVRDFRDRLRPPTVTRGEYRLAELDRLVSQVFYGHSGAPTRLPTKASPLAVEMVRHDRLTVSSEPSSIRLRAKFEMRLTTDVDNAPRPVRISFRSQFYEDGRPGARCHIDVTPPSGFSPIPDSSVTFEGILGYRAKTFIVHSAPYRSDWTCRVVTEAEALLDPALELTK